MALDMNFVLLARALSRSEGCRGVLGLFDGVLSSRALLCAPLRLVLVLGWQMLVCYKPLACKKS